VPVLVCQGHRQRKLPWGVRLPSTQTQCAGFEIEIAIATRRAGFRRFQPIPRASRWRLSDSLAIRAALRSRCGRRRAPSHRAAPCNSRLPRGSRRTSAGFARFSGAVSDASPGVDPVEARLRIFILSFQRSQIDLKEQMAIIGSPFQIQFHGFVVGQADGRSFCGVVRFGLFVKLTRKSSISSTFS
jgi:hypothetical protein